MWFGKRKDAITIHVLIRGRIGDGWYDVDERVALPPGTTLAQLVADGDRYRLPLAAALAYSTVVFASLAGCDGRKTTTTTAPLKAGPESPTAQAAGHDPHCSDPGSCGAAAVPHELYKVPLGDSPTRGGVEAKVTLVEFCDFQWFRYRGSSSVAITTDKAYAFPIGVPWQVAGRKAAPQLLTPPWASVGQIVMNAGRLRSDVVASAKTPTNAAPR